MNTSKTDWDRLGTMSDEETDTSEIPPLDESFFSNAELRVPVGTVPVVLNLDQEVVAWYQRHGTDFHKLINAALREYAESRR